MSAYNLPNVSNYDSTDEWVDWWASQVAPPSKIEATWSWRDQGWGNQKGTIRAVLVRGDQEVATVQLGPIAPHDTAQESFVAEGGEFIDSFQTGDTFKLQYLVGGGGGHELFIENFVLKLSAKNRSTTLNLPDVDNSDSTDDWVDWFTSDGLPAIAKIEANWTWNDQGWGNQKGTIRAVLVRGDQEVVTLQIGQIAPHDSTPENFVAVGGDLISQSQNGDKLKFQYLVGGGGGHQLFIQRFEVTVTFQNPIEFQLPNVENTDSTDDWVDWFTSESLPVIAKIEANWTWNDQGWGNQKGTIRAVLVREDQEVATEQIGQIAPHDSTPENFVIAGGDLISQSQNGDKLKFQYLVGGGGGHQLFINDFKVKIN